MGGIYSGFFTPTEAGAVALLYSIFLCTIWYRTLSWEKFTASVMKAGKIGAMIILIIIGANITGNLITMTQITQQLLAIVNSFDIPNWIYIASIVVFLIILGGPLVLIVEVRSQENVGQLYLLRLEVGPGSHKTTRPQADSSLPH